MSVIILSENSEVKASTIPVSVDEEEEKTMALRIACGRQNDSKNVS
jgi:hypothetical protein